MAKLNLLKHDRDFSKFRGSRSFQGRTLRIRIVSTLNQNFPRFGFIVPKKILSKASDRNTLKRRLKTILARHQKELKGADILFFPAAVALKRTFADLEAETLQLFKNARIWKS